MDKRKRILILGARGMLGNTVYEYLKLTYPNTLGTDKNKSNMFFLLRAETFQKDLTQILKDAGEMDYIINCIGLLPNVTDKKLMNYVNSIFPKKLAYFAEKAGIKIISISSDAVFSVNSGIVFENTIPHPDSLYGKTKLNGEVNRKNVVNIRTSIIGFDKNKRKGLLEWALSEKNKTINGYVNQKWSGCTTLQYARLCNYIIRNSNFVKLRSKSPVFHYVPLGPMSKYDLLSEFVKILKLDKTVRKFEDEVTIDRQLKSIYNIFLKEDINHSLEEILEFDKK